MENKTYTINLNIQKVSFWAVSTIFIVLIGFGGPLLIGFFELLHYKDKAQELELQLEKKEYKDNLNERIDNLENRFDNRPLHFGR